MQLQQALVWFHLWSLASPPCKSPQELEALVKDGDTDLRGTNRGHLEQKEEGWGYSSVVERLPGMCKVLGSTAHCGIS